MLELQQEREQTVVLVRAAVGDDDVQWPVHLGRVGGGVKRCECERKQRNTKLELERGKKNRCEKERCASRDADKGGERVVMGRQMVRDEKRGKRAELGGGGGFRSRVNKGEPASVAVNVNQHPIST